MLKASHRSDPVALKHFGSPLGTDVALREERVQLQTCTNKNVLAFDFQQSLEHFPLSPHSHVPHFVKALHLGVLQILLSELKNRNLPVPAPRSGTKQTVILG